MKRVRDYIQCGAVVFIFLVLFIVVTARMLAAWYLQKNDSENKFIHAIAAGITIQTTTDDQWNTKYPYEESFLDKVQKKVVEIRTVLNAHCTASFPFQEQINNIVSYCQTNIMKCNIMNDAKNYANATTYVKEPVANVVAFSEFCNAQGISFTFIATPSKESVSVLNGDIGGIKNGYIVNRSNTLLKEIESCGVDTYSIAEIAKAQNHIFQYDASAHWYTADAVFAAGCIAKILNQQYGFSFDEKIFDENYYYNLIEQYPEMEKGIFDSFGYKFSFLVPKESDEYTMVYAEGEAEYTGSFLDVFVRPEEKWKQEASPYHEMYTIVNSSIYDIKNQSVKYNANKKILIIGDSFNWPVTAYLSQGVGEVVAVHNASFTGSMETYVKAYKPDAVIMVYNDAEYYEIFTTDAFYLR